MNIQDKKIRLFLLLSLNGGSYHTELTMKYGGGHGNPLLYSCLGNPMDRGAWRATVQGVTKSWTRMSSSHFPGGGRWHNFLNSYTLQTRNILWLLPVFQVVLVSESKDIWDSAGPRWDWNLGPSHSLLEVCFLNAQAYSALCVPAQSRPTLLWPHGLSPARLLCPWNFPGKNTGVHCCFLLQGIFPASWIKTVSPVSCIGRWTLYFCTPWEAHI